MGAKSFVDFGRNIKRKADGLLQILGGGPSDFGAVLRQLEPKMNLPQSMHRPGQPVILPTNTHIQVTPEWPKGGDKVIVIQDDEALVKKTVLDRLQDVTDEINFWEERGLWCDANMPDHEKTREYIEQLETEALELRAKRDLGDLEDLT